MSYSGFSDSDPSWNAHLEKSPQLVQDLRHYDIDRKIYWIPSVLNQGSLGLLFPEGKLDNWCWKYAKPVKIAEEERKNYPVPGTDEFHEFKLDYENAKVYGPYEFMDAIKNMGVTKEIVPNG